MIKVLHIIDDLYVTGALRSMASIAKYSNKEIFTHKVISFKEGNLIANGLLSEANIELLVETDMNIISEEILKADIVELHWWNSPRISRFFTNELPEMRLMTFYHMVGDREPHIISEHLVNLSDMNVPCNPYSYNELEVFKSLPDRDRLERVSMVYDAADFMRIKDFRKKSHNGFNVGYIGTISFTKLHLKYFEMSSAIKVPDIKFIICGEYDKITIFPIQEKLNNLGVSDKFEFLGYVDDIREPMSVMDVYGYPLCENTYAAGELNLQEVMYAGIVPVVFPHGGVKSLVIDNYTGIVVNSELEYTQAIEYLYQNPSERIRIGTNASEYANQIFGAENASRKMDKLYLSMMNRPKTKKIL